MESYYDFSKIHLAEVLGVSVGVISCAKSRYTHEKRIDHFATTLKLAIDFFYKFTDKDVLKLEEYFETFKRHN